MVWPSLNSMKNRLLEFSTSVRQFTVNITQQKPARWWYSAIATEREEHIPSDQRAKVEVPRVTSPQSANPQTHSTEILPKPYPT